LLALSGRQGSGESTLTRRLRQLIDRNQAPTRQQPRSKDDRIITARKTCRLFIATAAPGSYQWQAFAHYTVRPRKTIALRIREHFSAKWIRFAVEKCSPAKKRADSAQMETALASKMISKPAPIRVCSPRDWGRWLYFREVPIADLPTSTC
jgi:hypothetical protein